MADGSEKYRSYYAKLICTAAKLDDPRIEEAFRSVKREPFAGPGPWWLNLGGHPYVQTPDDDPAFLYQNLLLALDREREINIGMPSAHAYWLGASNVKEAETVVQVGAGSGYYTAILAHLVSTSGRVYAYEIDEGLAACSRQPERRASGGAANAIGHRGGFAAGRPDLCLCWCRAAKPHVARRFATQRAPLVPLSPQGVLGGMLLITRPDQGFAWPAKFLGRAAFIGCVGLQDKETGRRLT